MNIFQWYRKLRGGTWKYVGPKYWPEACWIRNSEPFSFEVIWEEEVYER